MPGFALPWGAGAAGAVLVFPCPLPKSLVAVGSQAEVTVLINITKVCSVHSEKFLWWLFSLLLVCFKPFVPLLL